MESNDTVSSAPYPNHSADSADSRFVGDNYDYDFAVDVLTSAQIRSELSSDEYNQFKSNQMTPELADKLAQIIKEWSLRNGALHYTHWFQPMTGSTAEKHDSFLSPGKPGQFKTGFSGRELIKGETDGSSFPSGGIRSTFEARGYTIWDMTSPIFIRTGPGNIKTTTIPTAFVSWTGEALDTKTPLLRSEDVLNREARKMLTLIDSEDQIKEIYSTLGAEQEFFLIEREIYDQRPDLKITGRSLFGAKPPRGQELEDHYFGKIPSNVLKCIQEVEYNLWRMGVPIKTRHNEVAPSQFEMAPIFERSTVASDHNMLLMEELTATAKKHDLVCLLHEKPFAYVNGSGKHNNWSLMTDSGENLLELGSTETQHLRFMVFLAAIIRGVHLHSDLLRAAIAVPGNDYRLGANEAPPAIISIYLGEELDKICHAVMASKGSSDNIHNTVVNNMHLGLVSLPQIPKDNSDRNRTSPFAFTGNKFEFRAVGSSQSCAVPIYHLNTIVAESLQAMHGEIESICKEDGSTYDVTLAIETVVRRTLREHYSIVFNGNNYSDDWVQEAEKRGLPIIKSGYNALYVYEKPKNIKLFTEMGVLNTVELKSRSHIQKELFMNKILIEARTLVDLVKTQILPAAFAGQRELAKTIKQVKDCIFDGASGNGYLEASIGVQRELLIELSNTIQALIIKSTQFSDTVDYALLKSYIGDLRDLIDNLETQVDADYWPFPKYSEILLSN